MLHLVDVFAFGHAACPLTPESVEIFDVFPQRCPLSHSRLPIFKGL